MSKSLISLLILCSLVISLAAGIVPAVATGFDEPQEYSEVDIADSETNDADISDLQEPEDVLEALDTEEPDETKEPEEPEELEELDLLISVQSYDLVEQFVSRLLTIILERPYTSAGLEYWANELKTGKRTGANVASSIFFSPEIVSKSISNGDFVDRLTKGLMGRDPSVAGRKYWVDRLNAGWPREDVFADFVHSLEFSKFCSDAGIERGTYRPPQQVLVRVFTIRLFMATMERAPTPEGLNFYVDQINKGKTGAEIAFEFMFSEEMENRELTDTQYIDVLCNALMGRNPSESGRAFWLGRLQNSTRHNIFVAFVDSPEFVGICRDFGITRGRVPPPKGVGPLFGKVIILDPGHGTSGSPGAAGYNEAVAMLGLARRIRPLLQAQGATVILTRDHELNTRISARCAMVNIEALKMVRATKTNPAEHQEIDRLIRIMQSIVDDPVRNGNTYMNVDNFNANRVIHPDLRRVFEISNDPVVRDNLLFISLHSNATGNGSTSVRGAEVYFIDPGAHSNTRHYYPGYSYTSLSRSFGNTILNHIQTAGIPRRTYGLRAENYAIVREVNVPAVLAENGFHTNPADRALLQDPAFMDRLAIEYQRAISIYFR